MTNSVQTRAAGQNDPTRVTLTRDRPGCDPNSGFQTRAAVRRDALVGRHANTTLTRTARFSPPAGSGRCECAQQNTLTPDATQQPRHRARRISPPELLEPRTPPALSSRPRGEPQVGPSLGRSPRGREGGPQVPGTNIGGQARPAPPQPRGPCLGNASGKQCRFKQSGLNSEKNEVHQERQKLTV